MGASSKLRTRTIAPRDVTLRRIDREANARRHYAIRVVDEPLFGVVWLEVEWGRIGARKMKSKRETFAPNMDGSRALARRWASLLDEKKRRGYREVHR